MSLRRTAPVVVLLILGSLSLVHADGAHVMRPAVAPAPAPAVAFAGQGAGRGAAAAPARPSVQMQGSALPTEPLETRDAVVNAGRSLAGLATISPAAIAALKGGVEVTPRSPVVGQNELGWAGHGATSMDSGVVKLPLTSDESSWSTAHVWVDADLVVNKLYVFDCALTSARALVVTFGYDNSPGNTAEPDPKTKRAYFAFKAKGSRARLNITAHRKAGEPVGSFDDLTLHGCTLLPAE